LKIWLNCNLRHHMIVIVLLFCCFSSTLVEDNNARRIIIMTEFPWTRPINIPFFLLIITCPSNRIDPRQNNNFESNIHPRKKLDSNPLSLNCCCCCCFFFSLFGGEGGERFKGLISIKIMGLS
jgi:hypothetical protein